MMETMDHSEVREILEDAAIEPHGLERLMAGDTPTASIVAGHLAACPDCGEELARLHRSVGLIQPTVHAVPPPELRARTLAFVAELGRPRGNPLGTALGESDRSGPQSVAAGAVPSAPVRPVAMPHIPDDAATTAPVGLRSGRAGTSRLGWIAGLAAALIVAVAGTGVILNARHEAATRALTAEVEALGEVARWTLRVDAEPDVRRIVLAGATSPTASGSLIFSPTSTELVVVADGLAPAAAGREYRCWVEVDGKRAGIGRMFFGGDIAYWVGDVPEVAGLTPNARFGVTLTELPSAGEPAQDVLVSGD